MALEPVEIFKANEEDICTPIKMADMSDANTDDESASSE